MASCAGSRPPSAQQAYDQLSAALEHQLNWDTRAKQAKELLNEMLESRCEARQLAEHHDTRYCPQKQDARSFWDDTHQTRIKPI